MSRKINEFGRFEPTNASFSSELGGVKHFLSFFPLLLERVSEGWERCFCLLFCVKLQEDFIFQQKINCYNDEPSFLQFIRTETETAAWQSGVETEKDSKTCVYVIDIDNGDYIKVKGVDFGKGTKSFEASIASASQGGEIEIRIDSVSGALLKTCK